MRTYLLSAVAAAVAMAGASSAMADTAAAKKWIDDEFQPSTLSKAEQASEMQWFIDAASPFKGMEINVLSEGIPTHSYESEVLTKAFEDITGIKMASAPRVAASSPRRSHPAGVSRTRAVVSAGGVS